MQHTLIISATATDKKHLIHCTENNKPKMGVDNLSLSTRLSEMAGQRKMKVLLHPPMSIPTCQS